MTEQRGAAERAVRILLLYPALQVGLGAVALLVAALAPASLGLSTRLPLPVHALQILAFGSAAFALVASSRRVPRALRFGAVLLVSASAYAYRPTLLLEAALPSGLATVVRWSLHLPSDAFLPLVSWLFVHDFPQTYSLLANRISAIAVRISLVAGLLLLVANAVLAGSATPPEWAQAFARSQETSAYWLVTFGLMLPALPYGMWKSRWARAEERRRGLLFLTGLFAGVLPIGVVVLLGASLLKDFMMSPPAQTFLIPAVNLVAATLPVTTTYAVWVERVLDVRLILLSALQYGLARGLVSAVAVLPFFWFAWRLFAQRGETIGTLLAGTGWIELALPLALGILALRGRRRAIELVDRLFFREQHDARTILADLAEHVPAAADARELAAVLSEEIDRAFHLNAIEILILNRGTDELVAVFDGARPLARGSDLAHLLASTRDPQAVDLESARSASSSLPSEDRQWIADGGFELLAPLAGSVGDLLGCMALGPKRSELAFSADDRLLLKAIAASAAPALERMVAGAPAAELSPADLPARECVRCRRIWPSDTVACASCSGDTSPIGVPYRLHGKFQLEERVGAGGMGVVYRASDLALRRPVAIKTLPRTSPEAAIRLRREARAMAAVSHPNLALIFGAESWRGTPLLVVEFLEGGTLEDRLQSGALGVPETLELGIVLTSVLERVHAAGILHRDIKPSNIGYDGAGTPKLLDFGLAQLVEGPAPAAHSIRPAEIPEEAWSDTHSSFATQGFIGTPIYMAPEALLGSEAGPSFDLWSTGLVLYEALAGRNPFEGAASPDIFDAIVHARVPDLRELAPDCPDAVAELLADCLRENLRQRPRSASELRQRLEDLVRSSAAA